MNHAVAIETLTECGASEAALEAEHSAIETTIRSLQAAVVANADDRVIVRILDTCVEFCREHFASEERFMREMRYAGIDAHRAAHKHLLDAFEQTRTAALDRDAILAMLDSFDLLNAFEEHVRNHDHVMHHAVACQVKEVAA